MMRTIQIAICLLWLNAAIVTAAAPVKVDPNPTALMQAMQGHRVVLLGEVHDNAAQHTLRLAALRQLVVKGIRPAIAFEQFDRERQPDIDRARRERPGDANYLIAQAKGRGEWQWDFYRPFVALALEYDLPIVAATFRATRRCMWRSMAGWPSLMRVCATNSSSTHYLRTSGKHEDAIAAGHCNLLRAEELPALARANCA
jgi:uncharacterized iron-regulated protein